MELKVLNDTSNVLTVLGDVREVVNFCNSRIQRSWPRRDAVPIEFCEAFGGLTVAIHWRGRGNASRPRIITATTSADSWQYEAGGEHPIMWIDGSLWYLGVVRTITRES